MPLPSMAQPVPVLRTAIGPTILISGVGLPLLTMTNRLGRIIDRSHLLARGLSSASVQSERVSAQLQVLLGRTAIGGISRNFR